jgi:hypothetical protein
LSRHCQSVSSRSEIQSDRLLARRASDFTERIVRLFPCANYSKSFVCIANPFGNEKRHLRQARSAAVKLVRARNERWLLKTN